MPELLTQLPCTAFIQALASRDPVREAAGLGNHRGPRCRSLFHGRKPVRREKVS